MPLDKPLEQITEQDLKNLITDQEREGRTLDYKRETYGSRDQDKIELCADVTSFANTVGGHLILGMEESEGLPNSVEGLSDIDSDKEILRLQQVLRAGTQPKLPPVGMHPVRLENGRVCVVIRIARSWSRPHAVVNSGEWLRYHARTSSGKYRLDVPEVRAAFLVSETTAEKMRAFRADRLASIEAREIPVPLPDTPRIVYHCIPADAFDPGTAHDLSKVAMATTPSQPIFDFAPFQKYNFDGLFMYEQEGELRQHQRRNGYVQVYGNGILEAVVAQDWRRGAWRGVLGFQLESVIIDHISRLRHAMETLEVSPPIFFFVGMFGFRGSTVYASHNMFDGGDHSAIDRTSLLFSEVTLDDESIPTEQFFKPVFDRLWMASAWPGSPSYGDNGTWNKERREQIFGAKL